MKIGEMYKFCGNKGEFINFVVIGGNAIFIIDLGMDASGNNLSNGYQVIRPIGP